MSPRVLGCGSRFLPWGCLPIILGLLEGYPPGTTIIEGEGPGEPGADRLFCRAAQLRGFSIAPFPVTELRPGSRRWVDGAGGMRNTRMLVEGAPTEWIAVHTDPELGRGTADMVRKLRAAGLPGRVVLLVVRAPVLYLRRVVSFSARGPGIFPSPSRRAA